jgi:hypothetical protein
LFFFFLQNAIGQRKKLGDVATASFFLCLIWDIDFDKDFAKAEYPFPHRTSLGFLEFGMF